MIRAHRLPSSIGQMPLAEDASAVLWNHPLAKDISEVFLPSTRGGMVGLGTGLYLPPRNGARVANCPLGRYGDSVGAGMGFRELTPDYLKFSTWPVTIVWVGTQVASPVPNSNLFMVSHNSVNSPPYNSYGLYWNGSIRITYNSAGSFVNVASGVSLTNNVLSVVSARITPTAQQITINGTAVLTASSAISGATYSATSRVEVGSNEFNVGNNTSLRTLMGVILRGVWGNDQEREFARNPWQILTPGMRLSLGLIDVPTYLLLMRRPDLLLKGL